MTIRTLILTVFAFLSVCPSLTAQPVTITPAKPRTIITTDGEVDDIDTLDLFVC